MQRQRAAGHGDSSAAPRYDFVFRSEGRVAALAGSAKRLVKTCRLNKLRLIASAAKIPWEWIATKSEARLRLQTHPTWRRRCCSIILPTDRPLSARSLAQFLCHWN